MRPQALDGIRIVSLAANLPGPLAAARLARSGAHVTKIDPPLGDALQEFAPAWYAQLVAGQHVVSLDLRNAGDRAELASFFDNADVFLTASRRASLAKYGLTWDILHQKYPRLCYVAIVGERSPHANRPGHDLTYQAAAGLLRDRTVPPILAADILGADRAVSATFELLLQRERFGDAGFAEVALAEAAQAFSASLAHGISTVDGVLGGGFPMYGVYRTADGWIALAALEPQFRKRVEEALGAGKNALEKAFAAHDGAHWERWGQEHDVPVAILGEPHA